MALSSILFEEMRREEKSGKERRGEEIRRWDKEFQFLLLGLVWNSKGRRMDD